MLNLIKQLLADPPVPFLPLGEVGSFVRGTSFQKKDLIESGTPAIHYGQIYTRYGICTQNSLSFVSESLAQKARKAPPGSLIIATTSENDEDLCKAVVWLGHEEVVVSNDACFYTHNLNPKYVGYFFQTDEFQKQKRRFISGTKVKDINPKDLAKIEIPVPPMAVQEEIVRILDKFDTLVHSLSQGLPREIRLRQRQYAYYRNALLTFR